MYAAFTLIACVVNESHDQRSFPENSMDAIVADIESGDVQIEGSSGESLVDARVYGFSTNADKAARNQEGVQYNINLENRVLSLDASTNYANAGVDYLVASPTTVDLALDLQNGDATLSDLTGTMVVLANEIDADGMQVFDLSG